MLNAEYRKSSCPQRDSAEHEEHVGAQSAGRPEVREQDGADLLEEILDRNNMNRAYKRVRANKGAPGIDGMTVEDALLWLREHREELLESIRKGTFKPQPVRRKEIPKPDGGVRKLGIPTVVDRIVQQALKKIKEYAEQVHTQAALVDQIKKYVKAGGMENGLPVRTEEGSPQGGRSALCLPMSISTSMTRKWPAEGLSDRYQSLHLSD